MKKHIKIIIILSVILTFILSFIIPAGPSNVNVVRIDHEIIKDTTEILIDSISLDISEYLQNYFPDTEVSPQELARICVEYQLDPLFVLSQAQLESHFGTLGRATITNSVFNVGAWDDGTNINYYDTPDESIEPYAQLLTNEYLIENKTIDDLLVPGGFVNINGHRYATAANYEYHVKWLISYIEKNSDIKSLSEYSLNI